jgi:hypothetical protein
LLVGKNIDRTKPLAAGFTSLAGTAHMLMRAPGAEVETPV